MGFSLKSLGKVREKSQFAVGAIGMPFVLPSEKSMEGFDSTTGKALKIASKTVGVAEKRLPEAMALTQRAQAVAQTGYGFAQSLMANPMGTPQPMGGGGGFAAAPQPANDNTTMYILLAGGAAALLGLFLVLRRKA